MPITQPDICPVKESGDLYELRENYTFELKGHKYVILAGFMYDGASCANLLFQRDGIHRAAALVHDWLYVYQPPGVTRLDADKKFKEMLLAAGVKSWHVWIAYRAVRLLGWRWWND